MNQEEMREYFGDFCKEGQEISLNSIDDFWDSFKTNINLNRSIVACRNHSKKKFLDDGAILYQNNFLRLCFSNRSNWQEISMEELRLRCVVMEYYFPNFMIKHFVPYFKKNKSGDVNVFRHKIITTQTTYPDTTNPHHVKMVEQAKYRYKFVKERYDMDLDDEVKRIQTITEEILANEDEAQSQLPLAK